jgi:hypothetical protein
MATLSKPMTSGARLLAASANTFVYVAADDAVSPRRPAVVRDWLPFRLSPSVANVWVSLGGLRSSPATVAEAPSIRKAK